MKTGKDGESWLQSRQWCPNEPWGLRQKWREKQYHFFFFAVFSLQVSPTVTRLFLPVLMFLVLGWDLSNALQWVDLVGFANDSHLSAKTMRRRPQSCRMSRCMNGNTFSPAWHTWYLPSAYIVQEFLLFNVKTSQHMVCFFACLFVCYLVCLFVCLFVCLLPWLFAWNQSDHGDIYRAAAMPIKCCLCFGLT